MAPFPESEDMTIKRLVVALRKNDFQLLKMGAYKLHEKFHTGYDFELIEDLQKIMEYVEAKHIPPEVSDILCSTIKEILSKKGMANNTPPADNNIMLGEAETTIDIEGAVKNALKETTEPTYKAPRNTYYDVPSDSNPMPERQQMPPVQQPIQQIINPADMVEKQQEIRRIADNAINQATAQMTQPFTQNQTTQDDIRPKMSIPKPTQEPIPAQAQSQNQLMPQSETQTAINIDDISLEEMSAQTRAAYERKMQQQSACMQQTTTEETEDYEAEENEFIQIPATAVIRQKKNQNINPLDDILIFYDDYKNETDYSKVKEYRNNLNFLFAENSNYQDFNILKQISSLTNIMDTEITEIDRVVSTLSTLKSKISFVTASQSQNVSRIFVQKNIDFEIPFVKKAQNEKNAFNLIPMLGFTNIFVCSNCNSRSLKTDFNTRTLSMQCPHCDSASFPDIYAVNSYNPDCNPIFWHRAFASFVKSKTWILVNPPLDENKEIIFDFIKAAYEAGRPDAVYILSKENDKKEVYRQMFLSINPDAIINSNHISQDKLCEEFIKEEITKKVFN